MDGGESGPHPRPPVVFALRSGCRRAMRSLQECWLTGKVTGVTMATKDYYGVLGVSRTATEKEIKSAYRKLARKFHPDVNPGDRKAEERFKEIAEAYEVLSNPDQRRKYDQFGHLGDAWKHAGEAGFGQPGGGGARWQSTDMGGGMGGFEGVDLSDLLGNFFGGGRGQAGGFRRPQPTPHKGEDVQYEAEVTLEEAFAGTERTLSLVVHEACPTCGGSGMVKNAPCGSCGGAGAVERPKTLTVKIPKGVQDGARVRLAGQGGPGQYGGPPGDLYIIPRIQPNARFERKGDDLYTEVGVTFPDAALGAEVEVQTMTGPVTTRVPAGTSSGQSLRLRGKGMPHLRGEGHGDLYARVRVLVPREVTAQQRELIEELRRSM